MATNWRSIAYAVVHFVTRPFVNLNPRAKLVFALRFVVSGVLLISLAALLDSGYRANAVYVARINCQRQELANGLFTALQDNFKVSDTIITTSEIKLLAQYTENKIKDTPQVIFLHLQYSCSVRFDEGNGFSYNGYEYNPDNSSSGNYSPDASLPTVECSKPSVNYVLDYRRELSQIGLNIILAYAYDADFVIGSQQSGFSTDVTYKPSASWNEIMIQRRKQSKLCIACLSISLALSVWMTMLTVLYYGCRSPHETDDSEFPILWKHIVGGLSLIIFITVFMASLSMIIIMLETQKEIEKELSTFGINMKLGKLWFAIMWLALVLSFGLFLLWGGSVWCNRSFDDKGDADEIRTGSMSEFQDQVAPHTDYKTPFVTVSDYASEAEDGGNLWGNPNPFESTEEYVPMSDLPSATSSPTRRLVTKSPIMVKSFFEMSEGSPSKRMDRS